MVDELGYVKEGKYWLRSIGIVILFNGSTVRDLNMNLHENDTLEILNFMLAGVRKKRIFL